MDQLPLCVAFPVVLGMSVAMWYGVWIVFGLLSGS